MDKSRTTCSFGPSRRLGAIFLGGAVVAAAVAVFTHDPGGRLIASLAAVVLAAIAISDLVFTPRLVASSDGLVVRSPSVRVQLGWDEIDEIRVDARTHVGLINRTLEIDAGEQLIVLSRRALGLDPRDVHALVTAFEPPRAAG